MQSWGTSLVAILPKPRANMGIGFTVESNGGAQVIMLQTSCRCGVSRWLSHGLSTLLVFFFFYNPGVCGVLFKCSTFLRRFLRVPTHDSTSALGVFVSA